MRISALIVATVLLTSVAVPAAVGGAVAQNSDAHAGTHVSFDVESNALVDYAVDGDTLFEEVTVQSESESDVGVGVDARSASEVEGAGLSVASETEASVRIESEGESEMTAHDNERGHLVVNAGSGETVVGVETSGETEAESDGDRVVVDSGETTGTFLVVGEGEVTVDDEGDVVAELEDDSQLVFRSNGNERDDDDREQEEMIESGDSVAELHVFERDGERVVDAVQYSSDTTIEAAQQSEGYVELTVERTTDEGTVLITSVSDEVVENAEDLEIRVDGEATADAESYSELRSTANGDDGSSAMVTNTASTESSADVLVAIDGFSERTVELDENGDDSESGDGNDSSGDGDAGDDTDGETGDDAPGFGVTAALVALLSAAFVGLRKR